MPAVAPFVRAYEAVTRRTFPKLKPHALWHRQPIYYMGNHLTFATDGDDIAVPSYTRALDYELELGFVLAHPSARRRPAQEAEAAIGGFVVLNDFSARDVQLAEMRSGFGPQKAKHFRNAISSVVVSADEILPHWRALKGRVHLNGAARRRMRDRRRRRAGRWARCSPTPVAVRAALSWRVVRHRHAARRQRHRDTAACSTAARPSRSPSTASARSSNRIVASERSMKVIDLSRSPSSSTAATASSCRCASATSRLRPPSLLVWLLGLPSRLFPQAISSAGPTTPSPRWACIRRRTSMRPGTTARRRAARRRRPSTQIPLEQLHRPRRRARPDAQGRQRRHHASRPRGGARQDRRDAGRDARSC